MSRARRTVRIPDAVNRRLKDGRDPLWYAGELQTENGKDVGAHRISARVASKLSATPRTVVSRGGKPDAALRKLRARSPKR